MHRHIHSSVYLGNIGKIFIITVRWRKKYCSLVHFHNIDQNQQHINNKNIRSLQKNYLCFLYSTFSPIIPRVENTRSYVYGGITFSFQKPKIQKNNGKEMSIHEAMRMGNVSARESGASDTLFLPLPVRYWLTMSFTQHIYGGKQLRIATRTTRPEPGVDNTGFQVLGIVMQCGFDGER